MLEMSLSAEKTMHKCPSNSDTKHCVSSWTVLLYCVFLAAGWRLFSVLWFIQTLWAALVFQPLYLSRPVENTQRNSMCREGEREREDRLAWALSSSLPSQMRVHGYSFPLNCSVLVGLCVQVYCPFSTKMVLFWVPMNLQTSLKCVYI